MQTFFSIFLIRAYYLANKLAFSKLDLRLL